MAVSPAARGAGRGNGGAPRADEDADAPPLDRIVRDARVFEGVPHHLKDEALFVVRKEEEEEEETEEETS